MIRRSTVLLVLTILCFLVPSAANARPAETVETDISSREIAIESNFTGASIVVFGTVLNTRSQTAKGQGYDLAVIVRGPENPILSRRKSRVLGIWINTESRQYQNVPGFYAVLSNRPIFDIADAEILKKYGIGYDSLILERLDPKLPHDEFRDAIIRVQQREGLYLRADNGVSFVGKSLFRATVDLPANVPVGEYWADVFVFSGGKLLSHNSSSLTIGKQGFERLVYTMAFDYPLLYGIVAVIIAIFAGLIASAVFRKD